MSRCNRCGSYNIKNVHITSYVEKETGDKVNVHMVNCKNCDMGIKKVERESTEVRTDEPTNVYGNSYVDIVLSWMRSRAKTGKDNKSGSSLVDGQDFDHMANLLEEWKEWALEE